MIDQANKLRSMVIDSKKEITEKADNQPLKIYSVVSGNAGVGKTNFSINLAIKLQQTGKKVLVLDADIGLSNANLLLGVKTPLNLFHLLKGIASLNDIIVTGPQGVDLLSGGSDLLTKESLNYSGQQKIIETISNFGIYDVLVIDNVAGMSKPSLTFTIFAHEVILVTTPEPTAITDAYRVLKTISTYELKDQVSVVMNQVHEKKYGDEAFNKLSKTSEKFLSLMIKDIGFIFHDICVNEAISEQIPIVLRYPNTLASRNITQISKTLLEDENYNASNLKQLNKKIIEFLGDDYERI